MQPEASQLPVQQVEAEEGDPAAHVKESLTTAAAEPPAAAPQLPPPASPAHVEVQTLQNAFKRTFSGCELCSSVIHGQLPPIQPPVQPNGKLTAHNCLQTPTTPPTPPNEQPATTEKSSHEEGRIIRHTASQAVNQTALVAAASDAKGSEGEDTDTDEDQPQRKKYRKGTSLP